MPTDKFANRPLPPHLAQALANGEMDGYEARIRAREHYEHYAAVGGDMNDQIRSALQGGGVTTLRQRGVEAQRQRDKDGRFAKPEDVTPPSMNDLIRDQLGSISPGGTLEVDVSHLNEPPPDLAA